MTREEAIETVISKSDNYVCDRRMASCLVDTWAAVGMLKFDEPKSAWEKFATIMADEFGYSKAEDCPSTTLNSIKRALDKTGLKITAR